MRQNLRHIFDYYAFVSVSKIYKAMKKFFIFMKFKVLLVKVFYKKKTSKVKATTLTCYLLHRPFCFIGVYATFCNKTIAGSIPEQYINDLSNVFIKQGV